ncbi:M16 family metallopeptidase, partial [Candidatus Latescibacterota bacterium]
MFFKGTEKRGVGEMSRQITGLGGYNNAGTTQEFTLYYVALPSENFSLAADILVDAIRNSKFDSDEVEKELGVIKEEINRRDDDPSGIMHDEIFKIIFPDTPYSHPVLGTRESVSGLSREDFKYYLGKYYVPNNMTAVVVGDVNTDEAVEEIRKLTADWEPDESVGERLVEFDVPRQEGIHELILEKDVNMSYVLMAFQTAGQTDMRENASLDVVSSIFGEGRSSRLYKRIVEEEQIASSAQAYIYPMSRSGMFVIYGTMDEENVPKFRAAILEEIEKLRNESPDPAELEKVKTMLKADFQFSNETNSDIAQTLGYYNTLGMLDKATEYEKSIDMVTLEELNKYVNKTLTPDSYSIVIVNQRSTDEKEARGE